MYLKDGRIRPAPIRRKLCRESVQGRSEVVSFYRGRTQPLNGVATVVDGLLRLIDSALQSVSGSR